MSLLRIEGLEVRLNERPALRGAALRVAAGEIVALLGPNGAGKSTLLRAALGLIPISGGAVTLGECDPARMSPRERARRVAYLPQRPESAWPIPVAALVRLGRYAYGRALAPPSAADAAAVDAALAQVDLTSLRDRPLDTLSGGEQARAHLARALAQAAPLLVLDEPTAGLDPAHAFGVEAALRAHAQGGGGALFATHDLALAARAATHVLLLREGETIAAGPPFEALTPAALKRAYGRQGTLATIDGAPVVIFT